VPSLTVSTILLKNHLGGGGGGLSNASLKIGHACKTCMFTCMFACLHAYKHVRKYYSGHSLLQKRTANAVFTSVRECSRVFASVRKAFATEMCNRNICLRFDYDYDWMIKKKSDYDYDYDWL
jgi:CCR4-NOT transcriptional regulation complex NOT5 subunit